MRARILLVEDDAAAADFVIDLLQAAGYAVSRAANGAEAEVLYDRLRPDLVLLDIVLPDADGLVLCAKFRARGPAPVILVSGTSRRRDAVLGLRLGADDFIAKPFDIDEFEARIEAVLRRAAGVLELPDRTQSPAAEPAGFEIDRSSHTLHIGETAVHLTPAEYRLFSALANRPGEVVPRAILQSLVGGQAAPGKGRVVDVHIRRLRQKFESLVPTGPEIVSVRGVGYRLVAGPAAALGQPAASRLSA